MGIEKITDRIAAEAKADYDAVVGSAKQEARSILADAKAAAEKILADAEESGRTEKEKAVKYGKSAADIDAGKIILKKKQELLRFLKKPEVLKMISGLQICRQRIQSWKRNMVLLELLM